MSKKVIVVGAGINGLVAAFYLRRAGFAVTLIERANRVGGAYPCGSIAGTPGYMCARQLMRARN